MASGVRTATVHRRITSADASTTNNDKTVTSASADFVAADAGRRISGTNIPVGATIASVTSESEIELSVNATGTSSTVTLTIEDAPTIGGAEPLTLYGWSVLGSAALVLIRSGSATGPIIGASIRPTNESDTVSFAPQGVAMTGPIYIDWASAAYGDLVVEHG